MAKKRLLNCEFVNASSFKINLSNKAKLLYYTMFANADDRGFVDTTTDIIESLTANEQKFDNSVSLQLVGNDYQSALNELVERGLLYLFRDNHGNEVYLIRHWHMHNQVLKNAWTNYLSYYNQVYLKDNKYIRKIDYKDYKENNSNNIVVPITRKQEEENDSEWDKLQEELEKSRPKGED